MKALKRAHKHSMLFKKLKLMALRVKALIELNITIDVDPDKVLYHIKCV